MEKEQEKYKFSIGLAITRFLQGMLLGFSSGIPLFQSKNLHDTLGLEEIRFYKKAKDNNNARNGKINGRSYLGTVGWILAHYWHYLLGSMLGFLLFFSIPIVDISKQYPAAIYFGMLAMCLGFIPFEIYKIAKSKKLHDHILSTFLTAIITVGVSLILLFSLRRWSVEVNAFKYKEDGVTAIVVFVSFLFANLVISTSGLSVGTTLFLLNQYVNFSSAMNSFIYNHTYISLVLIYLLSGAAGCFVAVFIRRQYHHVDAESSAFNIAIMVVCCVWMGIDGLHEGNLITDVSTPLAQGITIACAIIASLGMSIALTIHGYRCFNHEDYYELNNISRNEVLK